MKSFLLFTLSFILVAITLIIDYFSRHFYLYWQLSWIHPIAHFVGGLGSTLFFAWVCFFSGFFPNLKIKSKTTLITFLAYVLIVGSLWEVYQYKFGLVYYSPIYISDTLFALGMDILGGLSAYFLASIII